MSDLASAVRQVISLGGGDFVGKTRLQKAFFLLEDRGIGFGLDFDYYHYGPYCEELSDAARDAVALGLLTLDWKSNPTGGEYAVYSTGAVLSPESEIDRRRKTVINLVRENESVVVELAATARYLKMNGFESDFWEEVSVRKSKKYTDDRMRKACKLLERVDAI